MESETLGERVRTVLDCLTNEEFYDGYKSQCDEALDVKNIHYQKEMSRFLAMCNDRSNFHLKNRLDCDKFSSLCSMREADSKVVCSFLNQPGARQADDVIQSEMAKCDQKETYYDNNKAQCDKLSIICDRKGLCKLNNYIAYLIENNKL